MQRMGYAASAFGNHEFDFGRAKSLEHRKTGGFPYLAANVEVEEGGPSELALPAFTNGRIRFLDIARLVEMVMERHAPSPVLDVGDVLDADRWARDEATRILRQMAG